MDALEIIRDEKIIEVMIMWLFNSKILNEEAFHDILFQILEGSETEKNVEYGSGSLQNPYLVLVFFLNFFSEFDWTHWGVSVAGLIALKPIDSILRKEEMGEEMDSKHTDIGTGITKGMMGQCDEGLTAIITEQRRALKIKKDMCCCSRRTTSTSIASSDSQSRTSVSPSPPYCVTPKGDGQEPVSGPPYEHTTGDNTPATDSTPLHLSSNFGSLPQNLKKNDICVLHPMDGSNLCHSKDTRDKNISSKTDFTVQAALKELYTLGFNKLAFFIQKASVGGGFNKESFVGMEMKYSREGESESEITCLAEECFPNLFKASRTPGQTQQGLPEDTRADQLRADKTPFLAQVLQASVIPLSVPPEAAVSDNSHEAAMFCCVPFCLILLCSHLPTKRVYAIAARDTIHQNN